MISEVTRESKYALRSILRAPGFAVLTVGTLGLAIGAIAGIFSVVNAVLLNPLPFADTDRLVYIAASAPGSDFPEEFTVAPEFFLEYQEHSALLEDVSMYNSFTNTLRVEDRIERVRMSAPEMSLFSTLGVSPMIGRLPVVDDEEQVAVISHTLWTTWFGSDPSILDRTVHVFGSDLAVIGVMGPDFWFPNDGTLLWVPQNIRAEDIEPGRFGQPVVARLAPGATSAALSAELEVLARRLPDRFGASPNYTRLIEQHRPVIRTLEDELLGSVAGPLWILLGSMAIVLVIACMNVGNLFMVRAERQQSNQAVRRALGAARGRLIRAQLMETAMVAGLAGLLATLRDVCIFCRKGMGFPSPGRGDVSDSVKRRCLNL